MGPSHAPANSSGGRDVQANAPQRSMLICVGATTGERGGGRIRGVVCTATLQATKAPQRMKGSMALFLPFSHDPFGVYAINFQNSKGRWAVDVPLTHQAQRKIKKGGCPYPFGFGRCLRSLKLMLGGGG